MYFIFAKWNLQVSSDVQLPLSDGCCLQPVPTLDWLTERGGVVDGPAFASALKLV